MRIELIFDTAIPYLFLCSFLDFVLSDLRSDDGFGVRLVDRRFLR